MFPLSDSAILVKLGEQIEPAVNREVHQLAACLSQDLPPGILEIAPGYASLAVHYDPLILNQGEVMDWVTKRRETANAALLRSPRRVEIPVAYNGPDLAFVAEHCRIKTGEVIKLHSGAEYTVYTMGFMPGFPYLGKLPEALTAPRLATPRSHVPAGSVAIAGSQTGIYPVDSPGGWRLIGQTTVKLYDAQRSPPFLLAPGDTVRFIPL